MRWVGIKMTQVKAQCIGRLHGRVGMWIKYRRRRARSIPLTTQCYILSGICREKVLAMRREFDMYDVDNSGTISADELQAAFQSLGFSFTPTQFNKIFKQIDEDESGFVDFREYATM